MFSQHATRAGLGRRTKAVVITLLLTASSLSCGAPDYAADPAWAEPSAMRRLFATHQDDRYAPWIELLNRMSQHRSLTIAEIGVWEGDFAYQILKNCPGVDRYYLVDPWRHLEDWRKPLNVSDDRFERAFETTMRRLEFAQDRIVVLRGTTLEVVDSIGDGELDLVYIDGDHTAKGIVIDLITLYPKVRQHGVIGGDDYVENIYHHDPKRFDPTMVRPVVDGFVAAHGVEDLFLSGRQFAFVKRSR